MYRLLTAVLLGTGLTGFALGWLAFSSSQDSVPQLPPKAPPGSAAPADPVCRFPLTPADVKVMMERPAVAATGASVLLAWAATTGDAERTLFLARSADGGVSFGAPVPFRKVPVLRFPATMKGKDVLRSTNVVPRLAVSGDTIFLAWLEPAGKDRVEYLAARSDDGGRTFGTPVKVHGPKAGRPTFTALAAGPDGTLACSWLDHRNGRHQPFCALSAPGAAAFGPEQMAFAGPAGKGVCPCCDTDVLRAADGTTFVAFRNNDDDVREMHVCRLPAGASQFESPVPVSNNLWKYAGCPHDGPVMAVSRSRLHVVWMDASSGRQRVYHGHSTLDRLSFTSWPLDPKGPGQQGHPRLAPAADGTLYAVWDGNLLDEPTPAVAEGKQHKHHGGLTGSGRAVMYATSAGDGFGAARALAPRVGAFQVNPVVTVAPAGDVLVAWSEIVEGGKSVAFLRLPARAK